MMRCVIPPNCGEDTFTPNQTDDLAIPSEWCRIYGGIFPQAHLSQDPSRRSLILSVTVTRPVLLTEVIVTALSPEAYQLANSRESPFEPWFSEERPIIRYGSLFTLSSDQLQLNGHHLSEPPKTFVYHFDMVEPVLQGFARKGETRFIVTLSDRLNEAPMVPDISVQDAAETDYEGIEIDEGFLASSAFSSASIFTANRGSSYDENMHANGSNGTNVTGPETVFRIKPLAEAVDVSEDHCAVYLRTADLGRTGFLTGDWVSIV
jgi:peroxin-6